MPRKRLDNCELLILNCKSRYAIPDTQYSIPDTPMSLTKYNQKRNFTDTPEPSGKMAKAGKELTFVVQRHEASHLHYDFRLEANGVLLSWAVPKGPSLYPKDKRLAVHVEDHPKEYAGFQGDIPKGNYGAGHVDVWDNGTYHGVDEDGNRISEKELLKRYEEGHLKIQMQGQRLKGLFKLIRLKKEEKNWLLIKADDEYASKKPYDIEAEEHSILQEMADTKATPKKLKNIRAGGDKKYKTYIKPMLAKLHEEAFDDKDWMFEIKWDGYRAIAECDTKMPRLYSRNGLSFEERFEPVFDALKKLKIDAILDGEVVAVNAEGEPEFQLLQNAQQGEAALHYYVFDLLAMNGKSTEDLPLTDRKELLQSLLPEAHESIHYSDHVIGSGKDFFELVKNRGLEGMMAKKCNSTYREGSRSGSWLKVKYLKIDEAIICGYTEAKGSRSHFGALVLGQYDDKKQLQFIGHTGTGFNEDTLKSVCTKMQDLTQETSPFQDKIKVNAPVKWLKPVLVCQIKFTEKTKEGSLRHPVFMGLRVDKTAKEVNGADASFAKSKTAKKKVSTTTQKAKSTSTKANNKKDEDFIKAGRYKVAVSNQDKIFWPDEGFTKGDLIAYYESISKYMLPHLKGRPLSLLRHPNGIKAKGFFHKNAGEKVPDYVTTETVYSDSSKRDIAYIVCNNSATLLYLANLGCIEMNPWMSSLPGLDNPDYLVIDLDPSNKNTFDQVIETALALKGILDEYKIPGYCKTSGSTGLHIYVPLQSGYDFDDATTFANILAAKTHELVPDFTSLERNLKKRGKKIYLDYLQNRRGQTVASAYSVRPKPGATVSAPLHWKEVKSGLTIQDFTIKNMLKRVEKEGDLFAPVLKKGINLSKALERMG